ncbi:hypothetical protein AAE478_004311 [Parahypoxylon ruwenzoriense]
MTHEHHLHLRRSTGSRRSTQGISRQVSSGSDSRSVISRLLGSLQHKNHEKKQAPLVTEERQPDWVANYKITHYPDRPLVDKRTKERLSEDDYAVMLERIQERNQRYHGLSGNRGRRRTPNLQTDAPNVGYSSERLKRSSYNRERPLTPASAKIERLSPADRASLHKGSDSIRSRAPRSPVSPGARTIRVYRGSAVDRGPIVRRTAERDKLPLLPNKAFDPEKSHTENGPQEKNSADFHQAKAETVREVVIPHSYAGPNATTPDLVLNSPPISAPAHQAAVGLTESVDTGGDTAQSSNASDLSTLSPKTLAICPAPGCGALLTTNQETRENLCANCRLSYQRCTLFLDGTRTPVIVVDDDDEDDDFGTFQALAGTKVDLSGRIRVTEIQQRVVEVAAPAPAVPKLRSKFSAVDNFKLQPPPESKRWRKQRKQERSQGPWDRESSGRDSSREDDNEGAKRTSSSPPSCPPSSSSDHGHIALQLAGWAATSAQKATPKTRSDTIDVESEGEGGEQKGENGSLGTAEESYDASSWTTESPPTGSSSGDNIRSDYFEEQPKGEDPNHDRNHSHTASAISTLAADKSVRSKDEDSSNTRQRRRTEDWERKARRAIRNSAVNRELGSIIDDIIDCYLMADAEADADAADRKSEEHERRKASVIAAYFAEVPEEVEMKQKGFI